MKPKQILTKAIEKAIDGGWLPRGKITEINQDSVWMETSHGISDEFRYQYVIFNHDFAKALWGDRAMGLTETDWQETYDGDPILYVEVLPMYKVHLQQMVIANDPIAYLGKNI